jgi:hypothetical protein
MTDNTDTQIKYEFKKKIARRIERIKDKKILTNILKIIKTINPDVLMTVNDNGVFIKFNDLDSETYTKLDNYLHKISTKLSDESESFISTEFTSLSQSQSQDDIDCDNKLSNKEKLLIKKQIYSTHIKSV